MWYEYLFSLITVYLVVAVLAIVHVLLYKRNSRAAFGWLGLILVFPIAGAVLYALFGVNRVQRKARRISVGAEVGEMQPLSACPEPAGAQLSRPGYRVTGGEPLAGNEVATYMNGEGAYPHMLRAIFHRARRPTGEELNHLLDTLARRIVRVLERRGLLIADPEHPHLDLEPGSSLDHLQAASIAYRIAIGPHAGRKALTLYSVPPLEETRNNPWLARRSDFSLHAATVCEAWQRSRLERLCRYITRPPIATKRLSVDGRGRVVYRYKQPFRDGSTHVVLEPLDFIARLAALVPRPRFNLTRFHGVFAPNFKHRARIVPRRARRIDADKPPAPMSWMQRLRRVFAMPQGTLS